MTKTLLTLVLLVALPAAAQVPFDQLPEQTTLDPTNQILVVDTTLADPLQQQRRMMLRRALDWVTANPAGTATDTLATLGIGGTVYNFAGGGGTADGVLTGGSVSGDTATFTRSIGADVDVSGFFSASNLIAGSGITLTPGAGNNRTIVANSQPFALYEEGIELTSNLHGINFRGFEVVVLDTPQGIANIRFGSILQDEGTELSEDGSHIVNYTGAGITSSFNNTTKALTVNVPGGTTLTAAATSGLLISGNAISFSPSRLSRLGAAEPAARSDDLVLKNESDANSPGLISVHNFLEGIAGNNLSVDGNNRQLNAEAADGVLDLLNVSTTGARQLNLTLGRSEGLAALTDTVQLPIATWAVANDALATGTAPPARLGTGTRNSTTFLRGDGVYAAAGGGGTVDGVVSTAHLSTTGARQLDLTLERTNGLSDLQTGINLPIATWAVEDNADVVGTADPFRLGTGTRDGTRFLKDDGVWSPIPVAAMPDWVDLPETPSTITADGCVAGNAAGDALEFVTCGSGGGGTDVVANPGGSPSDDLTTVTIAGTDYAIPGGGGGGGTPVTVTTADVASVTYVDGLNVGIEFTNTNEAIDTGIAVPANTKTILANWGAASTDATAGLDLPWFALPIEEWERLDPVDAGATPTQGNSRFTRTWRDTDVTTLGGTQARQIWIAKGNNGNVFVFTDNVLYDAHPFRVRFEIHTPLTVVTDVTGGGGSTTFAALTDTPTTITADQCVTGNAAGDALVFAACGSGSGDITSVSTASDSGLAGGADAGDVALSLDVKNLPIYDTPLSHLDHLPITDESVAGDPTRRLTLDQYATWAAGQANGGIGAVDGKFHIQPNELLLSTTPANADRLVGWDQSAFVPRAFELDTLRSYFRTVAANPGGSPSDSLTTISIDGTSYSIEGGGGTGDITAVNTPTNSGMLGGETTGDVTLGLDVSNLAGYTSTVSAIDHIAVSDESETDDPTRRLTLSELATFAAAQANGGIASTLGQFHIQSNELPIATAVADADRVVGWDQSAFSTRAFEASTLRDYVTDGLVEVEANPGGAPAAELSTITIDGTDYSIEGGGGGGTDAVFEHTTIATHTQTANIGNTDALAVTLDRNPAAGTLLKVVIVTTSESGGGTDTSYASTYLDSDDYLALTEITALPNGNQTETDTALNVPFVGANDSALPTVSRALTLNRGSGTTIYVRINGFFTRYEPFVLTVEELAISGGGGGGGSTTFTALTDTPAAITADECVAGNSAGDALEFVTCGTGGGGGDITAVTTPTNSGLAGGANTGDVDLLLDVSNLPIYNTTIDGFDHLVLSDESVTNDPSRRFTLNQHATWLTALANGGISETGGQLRIQPNELLLSTAMADADRVVGWDQSAFGARAFEASTLRDYVRDGLVEANPGGTPAATLTTVTIDGTDYMIEGGGGGGGDITAVLTGSGSGLQGGTTSGSANLAIANLAITTPRLASNAVTTNKIASGAVGTTDLANRAVTGGKIASSVHLDGNPTTTTHADSDNSTRIATTAFVQAVSGGGTGDITAVTTASGSGLAGGVETGDADLSLSLNGMGSGGALAAADEFPFDDKSDATQRTFLTSFANHAAWLAGGVNAGLGIGPGGEPNLDIADLANLVSLRVGDSLALSNTDDEDDDTQKMTIEAWTDLRAGHGLTRDGTGFFFDGDDLTEHGGAIDEDMDWLVVINDSFSSPLRSQKIRMRDFYSATLDFNAFGFNGSDDVSIRDGGIGAEMFEDDILNQLTTAAAVDPDVDLVAFVDRSQGDTKKVQVADLFDSAMGNQFARDSNGVVLLASGGVTNYAVATNAITKVKVADNTIGPSEIDPESATEGQVITIDSGGDPAWSNFESNIAGLSRTTAVASNYVLALGNTGGADRKIEIDDFVGDIIDNSTLTRSGNEIEIAQGNG